MRKQIPWYVASVILESNILWDTGNVVKKIVLSLFVKNANNHRKLKEINVSYILMNHFLGELLLIFRDFLPASSVKALLMRDLVFGNVIYAISLPVPPAFDLLNIFSNVLRIRKEFWKRKSLRIWNFPAWDAKNGRKELLAFPTALA